MTSDCGASAEGYITKSKKLSLLNFYIILYLFINLRKLFEDITDRDQKYNIFLFN